MEIPAEAEHDRKAAEITVPVNFSDTTNSKGVEVSAFTPFLISLFRFFPGGCFSPTRLKADHFFLPTG
jgi:hypothetical protein